MDHPRHPPGTAEAYSLPALQSSAPYVCALCTSARPAAFRSTAGLAHHLARVHHTTSAGLPLTQQHWHLHWSHRRQRYYYSNAVTSRSSWAPPPGAHVIQGPWDFPAPTHPAAGAGAATQQRSRPLPNAPQEGRTSHDTLPTASPGADSSSVCSAPDSDTEPQGRTPAQPALTAQGAAQDVPCEDPSGAPQDGPEDPHFDTQPLPQGDDPETVAARLRLVLARRAQLPQVRCPDDPSLPDGWRTAWDPGYRRYYYCTFDQQATWVRPTQPATPWLAQDPATREPNPGFPTAQCRPLDHDELAIRDIIHGHTQGPTQPAIASTLQ